MSKDNIFLENFTLKTITFVLSILVALNVAAYSADVALNGKLNTWAATTTNTIDKDSDASDSVGYLYVLGEMNTTVKIAENIKVVLEIELNDKVSDGASMKNGVKYTGGNGGPTPATVEVDEMYLLIDEFLMDALSVKIGSQRLEYSLRNNRRSMVINSDFTAFKGKFKFEKGFLDLFYGKKTESLQSINTSSDADIAGIHAEFNFNENIHVIGYINYAFMDNSGADHSNVGTIGAGVQYFLLDKSLELYGEIAFQFGDVDEDTSRSGLGADLGARWTFKELGSLKNLFIELNLGYRSGEDNDTDSSSFWNKWALSAGTLLAEGRYASESPLYQAYVDDNYLAIRLETGVNWSDSISSNLTLAYYDRTDEDADPYGVEVDLSNKYKYSENVSFNGHLAVFLPDDGLAADGDTIFAIALETVVVF